jgi:hypothetical protein
MHAHGVSPWRCVRPVAGVTSEPKASESRSSDVTVRAGGTGQEPHAAPRRRERERERERERRGCPPASPLPRWLAAPAAPLRASFGFCRAEHSLSAARLLCAASLAWPLRMCEEQGAREGAW